MQDLIGFVVICLPLFLSIKRAKSKERHLKTEILLANALNLIGVPIFFYLTRIRTPKPQELKSTQ